MNIITMRNEKEDKRGKDLNRLRIEIRVFNGEVGVVKDTEG